MMSLEETLQRIVSDAPWIVWMFKLSLVVLVLAAIFSVLAGIGKMRRNRTERAEFINEAVRDLSAKGVSAEEAERAARDFLDGRRWGD